MDKTPSWVKHFDENYRLAKQNDIEFSSKDLVAACDAQTVSLYCLLVFLSFLMFCFCFFGGGEGSNVCLFSILTTGKNIFSLAEIGYICRYASYAMSVVKIFFHNLNTQHFQGFFFFWYVYLLETKFDKSI